MLLSVIYFGIGILKYKTHLLLVTKFDKGGPYGGIVLYFLSYSFNFSNIEQPTL